MLRQISILITVPLLLTLGIGVDHAGIPDRAAVSNALDTTPRWSPPLARPLEVSSAYVAPVNRYGAGHRGIDIPANAGEYVAAPTSGTVTFSGRVAGREVVTIRVDAVTLVSLEPVSSDLSAGSRVEQGAALGTVTSGGHCASECVHLGVRVGAGADDQEYVNPLRFYLDKPVLLPW